MQVLDGGRIHEYDEPHVLLQNKDGIFYKMVQQTGKAEAASLIQLAKEVQKAVTKHAYLYIQFSHTFTHTRTTPPKHCTVDQ